MKKCIYCEVNEGIRTGWCRDCYTKLEAGQISLSDKVEELNDEEVKCELCNDTGYYGDNGPGIKGNGEYSRCECKTREEPYSQNSRNPHIIALLEAQDMIRILVEDKPTTVKRVIYTGERMSDWWKKWGKGQLGFPVSKDYPQ